MAGSVSSHWQSNSSGVVILYGCDKGSALLFLLRIHRSTLGIIETRMVQLGGSYPYYYLINNVGWRLRCRLETTGSVILPSS